MKTGERVGDGPICVFRKDVYAMDMLITKWWLTEGRSSPLT